MKIYISADIEGIGTVVRSEHSSVDGREYGAARRCMTQEVNAAIRGAYDAGATAVTVCDAHNVGLNILPEDLDERADLIMGGPRPLAMMEGIEAGYDAVFFIGYHARAGTADGPIAHVFTGRIAEVRLNGLPVGEIGLNAVLAGHFEVPVALVTGDEAAAREAAGLLDGVETVAVKRGIGAYAARCLHPNRCRTLVYEGAVRALSENRRRKPFRLKGETALEIRFTTASGADRVLRMPGKIGRAHV